MLKYTHKQENKEFDIREIYTPLSVAKKINRGYLIHC